MKLLMASEATVSGMLSSASFHSSTNSNEDTSFELFVVVSSVLTGRRVSLNQELREWTKTRWNFMRRQKLECQEETADSSSRVD